MTKPKEKKGDPKSPPKDPPPRALFCQHLELDWRWCPHCYDGKK